MVKYVYPLAREYRRIASAALFFLFAAFLLLLLVALSLTIIKPIYLLSVTSANVEPTPTSVANQLRFGVWGVCATSELNPPTLFANNGECFGPMLGYTVPPDIIALMGVSPDIVDAVLRTLLVILVLHPVAAGLALATLLASVCIASRAFGIVALVLAIVTMIVTTVVFGIDLALVLVAKDRVPDLASDGFRFTVDWGNGVWMILGALVALWIAIILLSARACYCCGVRRRQRY